MLKICLRSLISILAGILLMILAGVFIVFLILPANPSEAQIKIPRDKIKIPAKAPQLPDLDKLLQEEPPVSTSLRDAVYDIPFLDGYNPKQAAFLTFLPMSPQASIPLLPGLWEGQFQSYCLKAGTYAPGKGDGYAFAPLKGKQADIVASILKNSVFHPEIDQRDIQLLLWAIISRSKISEGSKEMQKTAKALMTEKEYDRLNGGALGKIPQPVLNAAMQKLPPLARDVFQAEARLREMLASAVAAPYHEVESVAVRVGEVLPPPDSRDIPSGRWNYDSAGYFIRFFPSHYRETRTQIYCPENFTVETDNNGLITSISDRQGMKIKIVYETNVEPLFFTGDDNVAGFAFKEMILTWGAADGTARTRNIKDAGWVLAGVPAGGGTAEGSAGTRFSDASDRYKFAVNHRNEVLELKDKLAKANPELKKLPDSAVWSVISLGNYCQAINLTISNFLSNAEGQLDEQKAAFTGLAFRAWMKGLALLANGELGPEESIDQAGFAEKISRGTPGPNPDAVHSNLFFALSGVEGLKVAAEDSSPAHEAEGYFQAQQRQSKPRRLPEFVWVKEQAPKWERNTRPKKLKPFELPQFVPDRKVAQPGNTGKQRLGQSGRKTGSGNGREAADNTRKMIKWFSTGTSAGSWGAGKVLGTATPYGIPKAVAGHMIGKTVGLWGDCIDAISMDPPRSDYTILARPEPGSFALLQPGAGMTRARAEAVNAYLAAAIDLTAKLRAARFSVERHSGAIKAGDEEWAGRQLENAIRYERESGLAMMVAADRLEALIKVVTSERVPDILLTPQLIDSYRNSISQEGFSAEELEASRSLNLTAEEIEEMKNDLLSAKPMEGPASLYQSALELAVALREFAAMLLALPVI